MPTERARFPATAQSVAKARRFLDHRLAAAGCDESTLLAATLLVSELATNAVVHAHTSFSVALTHDNASVMVEVADRGAGRPAAKGRRDGARGGNGLRIVDAIASEWGVHPSPDGKAVYFTLPC